MTVRTFFFNLNMKPFKFVLDDFLYTDQNEEVQLGPTIRLNGKKSFCLSMFVIMCSECSLNVILKLRNGVAVKEETYGTKVN